MYEYVSILKAKKTLPVYKRNPALTEDVVIAAFISGQAFIISKPTEITYKCLECGGKGRVSVKKGTFDMFEQCKHCNGKPDIKESVELFYEASISDAGK